MVAPGLLIEEIDRVDLVVLNVKGANDLPAPRARWQAPATALAWSSCSPLG